MRSFLAGLLFAPTLLVAQVTTRPGALGAPVDRPEGGSIFLAPASVRLPGAPVGEIELRPGVRRGDGTRGTLLVLSMPDPAGPLRSDSVDLLPDEVLALERALRDHGDPPIGLAVERPGERVRLRIGRTAVEFAPATVERLGRELLLQFGRGAARRDGDDMTVALTLRPGSVDAAFATTGRPPERNTYVDGVPAQRVIERTRRVAGMTGEVALVPGPRGADGVRGHLLVLVRWNSGGASTADTLHLAPVERAALHRALVGGGGMPPGIVVTTDATGASLQVGRASAWFEPAQWRMVVALLGGEAGGR